MARELDFRRVQGMTSYIVYSIGMDFIDFNIIPCDLYGISTHTRPVSVDMSFKEFADIVYKEFGIVLEEETTEEEEERQEGEEEEVTSHVDENYIASLLLNTYYSNLIVQKSVLEEKEVVVTRTDSGIDTSTGAGGTETEVPDIGVVVIYEVGNKKKPEVNTSYRTWVEQRDDIEAGAVLSFSEETTTSGGFVKHREIKGVYKGEVYSYTLEYTEGGIPDGIPGSLKYEARQTLRDAFGISIWYPSRSIFRIVLSEEYSSFPDMLGGMHKLLTSRHLTVTLSVLDDELLVNDEYSVTKTKIMWDWLQEESSVEPKYIEYISQKSEFHWNIVKWESEGGSINATGKGLYEMYRYDNVGYPDEPVIALVETQRQMYDSKPSPNFPIAELVFSRRMVVYGNPENAYEYNATFIESRSDAINCAKRIYEQLLYDYVSEHADNAVLVDGDTDYGENGSIIPGINEIEKTYKVRRVRTELCGVIPLATRNITYLASSSTRRTIIEFEERKEV